MRLYNLFKISIVLSLGGFTGHSSSPKFNDITIIVPSCDKYSCLWDPFMTLLLHHWPSLSTFNKHIPIIFLSNKKPVLHNRVQNIMIPNETSWSNNMLIALNKVKTSKVLILLEDYFITHFDEKRLLELVNIMDKEDIGYIQISHTDAPLKQNEKHAKIKGLNYKTQFETYRPSLQACLFKTKVLKLLLNPNENPWQFEVDGGFRSQGMETKFLGVTEDYPINYMNMSYQGHISRENMKKSAAMGAPVKNLTLPIHEDHKIYLWWAPITSAKYTFADIWRKIKNRF